MERKTGRIPTTSTTLLKQIAGTAEHPRWAAFVARYRPMMESYMRERFPGLEADDVIQETLLGVMKALPGYVEREDRKGAFHNFLTGVLRHKAIDDDVTAVAADSPSVVAGNEVGVGTPGYSAPEQFIGTGATVAADVYALGMLAEECFGGHPPRPWERIIRRATAALPRQRYADVATMLRAIRRRHWPRNAAWAALFCLLLALPLAWLWPSTPGTPPSSPSVPSRPPVTEVPPSPTPGVSANDASAAPQEPPQRPFFTRENLPSPPVPSLPPVTEVPPPPSPVVSSNDASAPPQECPRQPLITREELREANKAAVAHWEKEKRQDW